MKSEYLFDVNDIISKSDAKDKRLSKQLGDFGEDLVMTALGRLKKYKVAKVDHVGADLIAVDENESLSGDEKRKYAISVKTRQFGFNENEYEKESETYTFDTQKKTKDEPADIQKLLDFAQDFDAIPMIALVLITCDFSYIDIYLLTVSKFYELINKAEKDFPKDGESKPLSLSSNLGLTLNNYGLVKENGEYRYMNMSEENNKVQMWLQTQKDIDHMRLSSDVKLSKRKKLEGEKYYKYYVPMPKDKVIGVEPVLLHDSFSYIKYIRESELNKYDDKIPFNTHNQKDWNLSRQLGSFGENLAMFAIGNMKGYKIAIVDHVGADLVATDKKGNAFAISVKTKTNLEYNYSKSDDNNVHELNKLFEFAKSFGMIPAVAYVLLPKDLSYIDIYIITLDKLFELALDKNIKGIYCNDSFSYNGNLNDDSWKKTLEYINFSGIKSNEKCLQNKEWIDHMHIEIEKKFRKDESWI